LVLEVLSQFAETIVYLIPSIIQAVIILAVGFIVGSLIGVFLRRLLNRLKLDERLKGLPAVKGLHEVCFSISGVVSGLARWSVYLIAIVTAINVLQIEAITFYVGLATDFAFRVIEFAVIFVLGIIVADYIWRFSHGILMATGAKFPEALTSMFRLVLYVIVLLVAIDLLGFRFEILTIIIQAVALGLAIGIGGGIALAIGLGLKDILPDLVKKSIASPETEEKPETKREPKG